MAEAQVIAIGERGRVIRRDWSRFQRITPRATLADPLESGAGNVTAEIDLGRLIENKHSIDVAGQVTRPDNCQLIVVAKPRPPHR